LVSLTNRSQHKRGKSSLMTMHRKAQELQFVNDSTEAYITGSAPDDIISLQEVKDSLKELEHNPYSLHMEAGHANAHIREDMKYLVRKGLRDKSGTVHKVKAKSLGSRVIFINAQLARELIAKAPKKEKEAMKARLEKVMKLPDRESYGSQ